MFYDEKLKGTVGLAGTLVFRDDKGEVVKEVDFSTSIPLEQLKEEDGDQRSE